ncbi:MAG: hypothetical protein QOH71_1140 [Blastocatellia bacterium]|jgi:hypothetical protein|nr:hypothetical protein [Blastocatellia bacterium]
MAKNDVILLDGIIDQRLAEGLPSQERDEVFEFFVLEELLKDYDLSRDEIESGWIDGRDDGGIDGFYILINGRLLEDADDFVWPRSNAAIDVWLFTCKHHSTFLQAPLDKILATIQELFDLSLGSSELRGSYSDDLLEFRALFHFAYRRLSIGRPMIKFNVVYASRGDSTLVGESVAARARQIENLISTLFSSCSVQFQFIGAAELVEFHRKSKRFSLDLPFLEHLATGKDSYVLLVRLEDYWTFVSDDNGQLRRYLFDSNVRDYLGTNQVNEDISRSLADATAPDFWWLNNGVTILATNATVPGKTIQLQDIQIVNGLQTTETIHRHFQDGSTSSRDRALLVKIIVSSDAQARDRIIRATNNQSPVEVSALHATDKIQRDIEEILERHDWYYERRRNYYRNIGKPPVRFVTPLYLASSVVALIFKNPGRATRLKSKFMRTQSGYDAIFSARFPIEIWPVLVDVFKQVDAGLANVSPRPKTRDKFIRNWRALVALIVMARRLGTFSYKLTQLLEIAQTEIKEEEITEAWDLIAQVTKNPDHTARTHNIVRRCCIEAATRYGLLGAADVGRSDIPSFAKRLIVDDLPLSSEFMGLVEALLPPQPWKVGIHIEIASKLNCAPRNVSKAIQQLITDGKKNVQRDGVVYDSNGRILAADRAPVSPTIEDLHFLNPNSTGKPDSS